MLDRVDEVSHTIMDLNDEFKQVNARKAELENHAKNLANGEILTKVHTKYSNVNHPQREVKFLEEFAVSQGIQSFKNDAWHAKSSRSKSSLIAIQGSIRP